MTDNLAPKRVSFSLPATISVGGGPPKRRKGTFSTAVYGGAAGSKPANGEKKADDDNGRSFFDREEQETYTEKLAKRRKDEQAAIKRTSCNALSVLKRNALKQVEDAKEDAVDKQVQAVVQMKKREKTDRDRISARKRQERMHKRTRNIGDIGSFLKSNGKEWKVRDNVSCTLRAAAPDEFRSTAPVPTEDSVPPQAPADSEVGSDSDDSEVIIVEDGAYTDAFASTARSDLLTLADACLDPAIEALRLTPLVRSMVSQRPLCVKLGCANRPECTADVCKHAVSGGSVPPLCEIEARDRAARRKRTERFTPIDMVRPFSVMSAPCAKYLESVNRAQVCKQRGERHAPFDNLVDATFNWTTGATAEQMSAGTIEAKMLFARSFYWSEMGKLLARYHEHMKIVRSNWEEADTAARAARCAASSIRAGNVMRREMAIHEKLVEEMRAELDSSTQESIVAIVNEYALAAGGLLLTKSQVVTCFTLFVKLCDGASRGDGFYSLLIEKILDGDVEDLMEEVKRENRILASSTPIDKAIVSHRRATREDGAAQFSEQFAATLEKRRPKSVTELSDLAMAAQEARDMEPDTIEPVAAKRARIAEPVDSVPLEASVSLQPSPLPPFGEPVQVCAAQGAYEGGTLACTPIALMVAHRMLSAATAASADERTVTLDSVNFDSSCRKGAKILTAWHKKIVTEEEHRHTNALTLADERGLTGQDRLAFLEPRSLPEMMTTKEVLSTVTNLAARFESCGQAIEELFCEPDASSELGESAMVFSAALQKCEELGVGGRFTAVLTVRGSSICIGKLADKDYFVFDSHGVNGSSIVRRVGTLRKLQACVELYNFAHMDETRYALFVLYETKKD